MPKVQLVCVLLDKIWLQPLVRLCFCMKQYHYSRIFPICSITSFHFHLSSNNFIWYMFQKLISMTRNLFSFHFTCLQALGKYPFNYRLVYSLLRLLMLIILQEQSLFDQYYSVQYNFLKTTIFSYVHPQLIILSTYFDGFSFNVYILNFSKVYSVCYYLFHIVLILTYYYLIISKHKIMI